LTFPPAARRERRIGSRRSAQLVWLTDASSRDDRHSDGERPHARRRKRSKTLVALKPDAAAISFMDSSGRVRSSRQDSETR